MKLQCCVSGMMMQASVRWMVGGRAQVEMLLDLGSELKIVAAVYQHLYEGVVTSRCLDSMSASRGFGQCSIDVLRQVSYSCRTCCFLRCGVELP